MPARQRLVSWYLRDYRESAGYDLAQLRHLAELAGHHRHVTIRLLPFASRLSPAGGTGGFSVLRFGPAVDLGIVYVAGPDGGLFPADPHAAVGYLRAFDHLGALALSPEATTRRLLELAGNP